MSFMTSLASVVITSMGLVMGAVYLERTASLPSKPSVLLRVWSGELPSADLERSLSDAQQQAKAARAAAAKAQAALAAQKRLNEEHQKHLERLDRRITEKEAGEWSSPTPPPR